MTRVHRIFSLNRLDVDEAKSLMDQGNNKEALDVAQKALLLAETDLDGDQEKVATSLVLMGNQFMMKMVNSLKDQTIGNQNQKFVSYSWEGR